MTNKSGAMENDRNVNWEIDKNFPFDLVSTELSTQGNGYFYRVEVLLKVGEIASVTTIPSGDQKFANVQPWSGMWGIYRFYKFGSARAINNPSHHVPGPLSIKKDVLTLSYHIWARQNDDAKEFDHPMNMVIIDRGYASMIESLTKDKIEDVMADPDHPAHKELSTQSGRYHLRAEAYTGEDDEYLWMMMRFVFLGSTASFKVVKKKRPGVYGASA